MSIDKEYRIKINKDGMGLTQALKKFIEENPNSILDDGDGEITLKEWNNTMDKLIEINEKRKAEGKESIFTGGTDKTRNGWENSFIVHKDAEIVFTEAEMGELFSAMGVTINDKAERKPDKSENLSSPTDSSKKEPPKQPVDSSKGQAVPPADSAKIEPPKQPVDSTKTQDASKTIKTDASNDRYSLSWGEIGEIAWNSTKKFVRGMFCDKEGFSAKRTAITVGAIVGLVVAAPIAATALATGLTAAGVTTIAGVSTAAAANAAVGAAILTPMVYEGGKKVIEGTKEYYQAETYDEAVDSMEEAMDGGVELASIPVMAKMFHWGGKMIGKAKASANGTKPKTEAKPSPEPTKKEIKPAETVEPAPTPKEFEFDFEVPDPVAAEPVVKPVTEPLAEPTLAVEQPVKPSGKVGKKGKKGKNKGRVEKFRPESEQVRRAREAREAKAAEEARLKAEEAKAQDSVIEESAVEPAPTETKPQEFEFDFEVPDKPVVEAVAEPIIEPVLEPVVEVTTEPIPEPITGPASVSSKPIDKVARPKRGFIERTKRNAEAHRIREERKRVREFNENLQRKAEEAFEKGKRDYVYNKKNRTAKVRNDDNKITEIKYDKLDRVISEVTTNQKGEISHSYEYEYNDPNSIVKETKVIRKDAKGNIDQVKEFQYDKNGNIIESLTKNSQGILENAWYYEYNSNGQKVKSMYKSGEQTRFTIEHVYDKTNEHKIKDITTYYDGSKNVSEYNIETNGEKTIYFDPNGKITDIRFIKDENVRFATSEEVNAANKALAGTETSPSQKTGAIEEIQPAVEATTKPNTNVKTFYNKEGYEFDVERYKIFEINQTSPNKATLNLKNDPKYLDNLGIGESFYTKDVKIMEAESYLGTNCRQLAPGELELINGNWTVVKPIKVEFYKK